MESKTFKTIINDLLLSKGLSKKGGYYYYFIDGGTIIVGLQKSNFSNAYYINIGYVINELNPAIEKPRDVDGDIRARFGFNDEGKETDLFDLEKLSENDKEQIKMFVEENIKKYIEPITSFHKLKDLLKENPVMLFQTKYAAKKFLGFE